MKYAVIIVLFCWLLCGVVGAWMLDDLDKAHADLIAKGPLTLRHAMQEHPATLTGGT